MRSSRGLSLLETMFCCALLGLFLSVVSQLVVSAYKTQGLYRDRLVQQRNATIFLQKVVRSLQGATDVRLVSTLDPPAALTELTGDGLLVTYNTADGARTSQFFRDGTSECVAQEQYGPYFNPSHTATWVVSPGYPKVEVRDVDSFSIEPLTLGTLHMYRIRLKLKALPQPFVRQVRAQPTQGL